MYHFEIIFKACYAIRIHQSQHDMAHFQLIRSTLLGLIIDRM